MFQSLIRSSCVLCLSTVLLIITSIIIISGSELLLVEAFLNLEEELKKQNEKPFEWKNFDFQEQHKYCIIGSGPAGVQLAWYLEQYKMDYVVFERAESPGSFFKKYPRQRRLISINKVYTGYNDSEYNLRHDWNSLIDSYDDYFFSEKGIAGLLSKEEMEERNLDKTLFTSLTEKILPEADWIPIYLEKFLQKKNNQKLKISFETDVTRITRTEKKKFFVHTERKTSSSDSDKEEKVVLCDAVILATGKSVEKKFKLKEGSHLLTSYTDAPQDAREYRNQEILILGNGNSAFELSQAMQDYAAIIHMASRHPIQFAHQTHYVGDVRISAAAIVDHYSLKSQHVLMTLSTPDIRHGRLYFDKKAKRIMLRQEAGESDEEKRKRKIASGEMGTTSQNSMLNDENDQQEDEIEYENSDSTYSSSSSNSDRKQQQDDYEKEIQQMRTDRENQQIAAEEKLTAEAGKELFPSRRGYHRVIACLGFKWNNTPFVSFSATSSSKNKNNNNKKRKEFPITPSTDASDSFLEIASNFESVNVENLFVAGALAHFRDFKRSAGGFIHGFRYTARTLAAMLRERFEGKNNNNNKNKYLYPSIPMFSREQVLKRFMFRLTNVSSLYQMQSQLCDVVLINDDYDFSSSSSSENDNNNAPYYYFQDLPLDNIKSKTPQLVSIEAFKKLNLHFITLSLEFGKDFQGVGVLYHQSQKETVKRRAEKMLWDWTQPTADPDFRLHYARAHPGASSSSSSSSSLQKLEKITAADLKMRDDEKKIRSGRHVHSKNQQQVLLEKGVRGEGYMPASPGKTSLLEPLQPPPTMLPSDGVKPPRLDRFLFLHPVIREWKRSAVVKKKNKNENAENSNKNKNNKNIIADDHDKNAASVISWVKLQLIRELRLHEDVLVEFTTKNYGWNPTRKFLEKVLPKK